MLNEDDIRQIIAKHFNVRESNVKLICGQEMKGYGMDEHFESCVSCTVDLGAKLKNP